ncbi:hypothetical protein [Halovivax gelatinilyticus]|nr:hypothetical protein [Halovivax gelatinilyticus]
MSNPVRRWTHADDGVLVGLISRLRYAVFRTLQYGIDLFVAALAGVP